MAWETKPSFFISSQHYDFVVSAFEEFVGGLDADRYTLGLNQNQTSVVIENVGDTANVRPARDLCGAWDIASAHGACE